MLRSYCERLSDKEEPCEQIDLEEQYLFEKIREVINVTKNSKNQSRTSQLWLQYLQMIDILFELYRGERTGDLDKSIVAKKHLLPYIAGGNRNHYTSSLWLDIQECEELSTTHPELVGFIGSDLDSVRRSDRFWVAILQIRLLNKSS